MFAWIQSGQKAVHVITNTTPMSLHVFVASICYSVSPESATLCIPSFIPSFLLPSSDSNIFPFSLLKLTHAKPRTNNLPRLYSYKCNKPLSSMGWRLWDTRQGRPERFEDSQSWKKIHTKSQLKWLLVPVASGIRNLILRLERIL